MYLHFSRDEPDAVQPISSLPGVNRYGVNKLVDALTPLVQNGLSSVSKNDAVQLIGKFHPFLIYFYCILLTNVFSISCVLILST